MALASLPSILTIDANTSNQRLDRFLRKYFKQYPDISLVMIFKAIRTGQIKVQSGTQGNGVKDPGQQKNNGSLDGLDSSTSLTLRSEGQNSLKAKKVDQSYALKVGDQIVFHQSFLDLLTNKNPAGKKSHLASKKGIGEVSLEKFQSWIISEDEERLVINKPAGISIHPGNKMQNAKSTMHNDSEFGIMNYELSLYDLIKQYYSSRGFAGSMFQPNVAYRLDKDTSGLVIVAKTYAGLQHLNEQIRDRKVEKEYYAVVIGRFPLQLTCNKPMKKVVDEKFGRGKMMICSPDDLLGQDALTIGHTQKSRSDPVLGTLSLVRVELFTGRMHQIRVHFANAGYPILGDIVYGVPSHNRKLQQTYGFLRQLLHCHRYSFTDMNGKKVAFEAPIVEDMKKVVK